MGWFWNSEASKQPSSTLSIPPVVTDDTSHSPPPSLPKPDATSKPPPSKSLRHDQETDQELAAWLKELEAEIKENSAPEKLSSKPERRNPDDISPDSLYPTEMSCRSTLDYAVFCQSFGGQFVNIYRYGTFRSCSNHWQDFWLCMRTRQWEKPDREKAIADHFRKKAVKYKQGPSSEDVWEMRTEPVKDAFQGDLEALERQVAEWKRQNPGAKAPWER